MLASLWLPILVSAVAVFIASFLAWMVLPHHKGDFSRFPDEDKFLALLRNLKAEGGQFMFPYCDNPAELKDPDKKKKWEAGPHGVLRVWPGAPNMGRNLLLTFIFYVVVGVFVGYIGSLALERGAGFMAAFRVTGAIAVVAYALGGIPHAIWMGRLPRSVMTDLVDNVVYGLITGLIFAWLWPAIETVAV